jgi:hypothetical protein
MPEDVSPPHAERMTGPSDSLEEADEESGSHLQQPRQPAIVCFTSQISIDPHAPTIRCSERKHSAGVARIRARSSSSNRRRDLRRSDEKQCLGADATRGELAAHPRRSSPTAASVLNLIINAVQAMSGVSEGSRGLLIGTGKHSGGVLVAVQDSGPGLKPESFEHLFDSFYTTKPSGMGMGLSICRSIVEAHDGRIWATPNAGPGITVQFTLPINDQATASARPAA